MTTILQRPSNDTNANKAFGVGGHHGTDWGWGQGDAVYAMADGTVTEVKTLGDYGKIIRIDHGTLCDGKPTQTRYCHLSRQDVAAGKPVKRGQQIGVMGDTGTLSQAKHLHSELWLSGVRVDEQPYQKREAPNVTNRTTLPIGANLRTAPAVTADKISALKGNWGYDIQGWITGGLANGSTDWFATGSGYAHSSGFTDPSRAGLPDLNPVAPPVVIPPVTPPVVAGVTKAEVETIVLASEKRVLAAIAALPKPVSKEDIGAEVIRQQKLAGN